MRAEQIGDNIVQRLIGRLSKLRVGKMEDVPDDSITGSVGAAYARMAAWTHAHGREFEIEAHENPGRAGRYLQTGVCSAHRDGPTKH